MASRLLFLVCFMLMPGLCQVAEASTQPNHAHAISESFRFQQDPEAIAKNILADDNYETKLPRRKASDQGSGSSVPDGVWDAFFSEFTFGLLKIVAFAVFGLLIFFALKNSGMLDRYYNKKWRSSGATVGSAQAPVDLESFLEVSLDAIRKLASEGRYGEAVHLLLLQTFEELVRLAEIELPKSLTSREILAQIPLPRIAQENLGHLIVEVEGSHFGGDVVTATDYEACLKAYDTFLEAVYNEVRS